MRILFIGGREDPSVGPIDDVVDDLVARGHEVVLALTEVAVDVLPDADLVVHLDPTLDEESLAVLRARPSRIFATTAVPRELLRASSGLLTRSRRSARTLSARGRRIASVVPPRAPSSLVAPGAEAVARSDGTIRLVSFVGPATRGPLVEIAYALSMLRSSRVVWRLVDPSSTTRTIVEICAALGVEVEVAPENATVSEELAAADVVLAPAATDEDPLTDETVLALSSGRPVLMAEEETDLPHGAYLPVRARSLPRDLVEALQGVLDGTTDLARIGRAAAAHASTSFTTRARADALLGAAAQSLRGLIPVVDAQFPELAAWGVADGESPATVYVDDFRILR